MVCFLLERCHSRQMNTIFTLGTGLAVTPSSDPFSMFAMAVPMYVFYEGAILTGRALKK